MQKATSRALYEYWNNLRGSRSAPERRDIDPTKIRSALSGTFILEVNEGGVFDFRLAGSHLCSAYCRELKGRSFSQLWHDKDGDAIETLIRAVTEDNAVALVTFQGATGVGTQTTFETILLPLRHNGSTNMRILGGMSVVDEPYWFGTQPVIEQRITGLRLIWPDDKAAIDDKEGISAAVHADGNWSGETPEETPALTPLTTSLHGNTARRYAHLAVIDGGRNQTN